MVYRQRLGLLVSALVIVTALNPGLLQAQTSIENVFLPAPRELEQRIRRAEKAIAEAQFGEAVMFLGGVLDGTAEDGGEAIEDYFVTLEGNTKTSLKSRAEQLIGEMPKKGRDLYEVQYGAEAKRLLNEALESGNADSLSEVSSRYFHTKSGYEATMLLGRHYLRRGRPVAAAISFRRITKSAPAAARFEPSASFMLATSWRAAGRDDAAKEVLANLKSTSNNQPLEINGQKVDPIAGDQDVLEWHESVVGKLKMGADAAVDKWALHRGNAARNAETTGSMPLLNLRWFVEMGRDETDQNDLRERANRYQKSDVTAIPTLHPLVVGNWVLFRNADGLLGIDLRTGKRIWPYPWHDSLADQLTNTGEETTNRPPGRTQELHQRVWDDSPWGQMSSDGRAVFLVDDLLSNAQPNANNRTAIRNRQPNSPHGFNSLVALNIQKEGKMLWRIGGLHGEDEPKLAGAFFLGPPLPIAGELYCLVEINGETKLAVVDAKSGELQWSQQLTHLENTNIISDTARRSAGASPSFSNGVLVCPTSSGAVVGVDIANRSLMWGYAYQRTNAVVQGNRRRVFIGGRTQYVSNNTPPIGKRWADSLVTLGSGTAVLTPIESSELHCLDILTGKKKWSKSRGESLFVAGIHEQGVVVVGKDKVTKFDSDDGKELWKMDLPDGSITSGMGFISDGLLYLATTGPEILAIDLTQGNIATRLETEEPLGNLIAYRDTVLSVTSTGITAYFQSERLDEIVKKKLSENPDDPEYLEHLARLQLRDGNRQQSIDTMRRVIKGFEESNQKLRLEAARTQLTKTLLDGLRENDELDAKTIEELRELIANPDQHFEFQRLLANAHYRSKDYTKAFDAYLKIADQYIQQDQTLSNSRRDGLDVLGRGHRVRRDRWLRYEIGRVLKDAGNVEDLQSVIDQRIRDALTNDSSTSQLSRFVSVFENCPGTNEVKLRLAEKYLESTSNSKAELLLTSLLQSQDHQQKALLKLAEMYKQLGKLNAELDCYGRLSRIEKVEFDQETTANLENANERAKAISWPIGNVEKSTANGTQMSRYPSEIPMPLGASRGAGTIGTTFWTSRSTSARKQVSARDGMGNQLWTTHFDGTQGYRFAKCHAIGHLLICSIGYDVAVLDLLVPNETPSRKLWQTTVRDLGEGTSVYRSINSRSKPNEWGIEMHQHFDGGNYRLGSVSNLSPNGLCVHVQDELRCLDPSTGDILWSRSDVPSDCEIWGDDQHVFALRRSEEVAKAYRLDDGAEVGKYAVPNISAWLQTRGRQILTWSAESNGNETAWKLHLFDPLKQERMWQREFPVRSRANFIRETDEIAILDPEGKINVLNLEDGKDKVVGRVDLQDRPVSGIHAFSYGENVIVMCRRTPRAILDAAVRPVTRMLTSSSITDAEIHAIERKTGKQAWDDSVVLEQFELPLLQSSQLPIWFFGRNQTTRRNTTRGDVTIIGIDKRTGKRVIQEKMSSRKENMRISSDPKTKKIVAQLPDDKTYTYSVTDQPVGNVEKEGDIKSISDLVEDFFGDRDDLAEDPFDSK